MYQYKSIILLAAALAGGAASISCAVSADSENSSVGTLRMPLSVSDGETTYRLLNARVKVIGEQTQT